MNDRANDAVKKEEQLSAVAGVNLLGCGINKLCWPGQVRALNRVLDTKRNEQQKTIDGTPYLIGEHVEFSDRPSSSTLIETFESTAEYDKKSSVSVNAKGKYGAFSAGFDSTFRQSISTLDQHYAAMRHDIEQLWAVEIKNLESNLHASFVEAVKALPEFKDDRSTITKFINFFTLFGTDVVTEVTVGGSVAFSVMIEKSASTKKTDADAALSVGYGTFVANASTQISEEQKNQARKQKICITTKGGPLEYAVSFDPSDPTNCNAAVKEWRAKLKRAPLVVDMQLAPIDEFVPTKLKKQQEAIKQAREWCLSYQAEINATWKDSTISIKKRSKSDADAQSDTRAAQQQGDTSGAPTLNIAIVGSNRVLRGEERLEAPDKTADRGAFTAFWQRVAEKLGGISSSGHEMVLLATERWPRDLRYYPPVHVRTLLCAHGADATTLERWEKLVQHMQPCNIAGLTYVLAGRPLSGKSSDFIVAGFGTNPDTIRPTVKVELRVIASDASTTGTLVTALTEEAHTKLHTIRNRDGDKAVLAAGTQLKTTIEMVKAEERASGGGVYLGKYWYFLRFPRYGHTPNSHILINYETGACLQSKIVEKEPCRLQAFGNDNPPRQDDILWDVRDEPATHFLALHYCGQNWNLTQTGKTAGVKQWRENYMIWSVEEFNNFYW